MNFGIDLLNSMMIYYLLPAIWGGFLLLTFVGYGTLLKKSLFPNEHIGWANEAAWGMSLAVILGGLLNYLQVISRPLLIAFVFIGIVMAVKSIPKGGWFEISRLSIKQITKHFFSFGGILKALALFLAGVQYLYSVGEGPKGGGGDDIRGYFTFSKQMIEAGGLDFDPLNSIRIGNGLGGQSFLQALMLAISDFINCMLIDGGLAMIICFGLILKVCTQKRLGGLLSWFFVLFFLFLPLDHFRLNSSSLATGMVVFLAICSFLERETLNSNTPVRNAIIISLLSSSACAMKTNYIPPMVFMLGISYSWYIVTTRFKKQAILEALLTPILVLLFLLPWMLLLKRTSGTMLHPIFGTGYDESNYGFFVNDSFSGGMAIWMKIERCLNYFVWNNESFVVFLLVGAYSLVATKISPRAVTQALILGIFLGALTLMVNVEVHGGIPIVRYIFAVLSVGIVYASIGIASDTKKYLQNNRNIVDVLPFAEVAKTALGVLCILTTVITYFWYYDNAAGGLKAYQKFITALHSQLSYEGALIPRREQLSRQAAQAAVPAREIILSRDFWTLLYDYGRNKILNFDPGGSSLPPGAPYFQKPDALAEYLLKNGIRYVAYSYEDQAGYPVKLNLFRHKPERAYMHRIMERAKVAVDHQLYVLGFTRKRIFDDGSLFVLDLKAPTGVNSIPTEPNYFQLGKVLVLVWAKTQGFDQNKVWTNGHGVIENIHYVRAPEDNMIVLNTFGYHPLTDNVHKLSLELSVNGTSMPFVKQRGNSFFFSIAAISQPITSIAIRSSTFIPDNEQSALFRKYFRNIPFGSDPHGIDVDTIQITNG